VRLPGDVLLIAGTGLFCYDVLKKRLVKREQVADATGGTPISRRIFGGDDEPEREPRDD
jgi:nitric oxide reductase subunit B